MAFQPLLTPLVTAAASIAASAVLQWMGIYWETLTDDADDAAMRALQQRLASSAWCMTRRASAGKSVPGYGLFLNWTPLAAGWIAGNEERNSTTVTLVCTRNARTALLKEDEDQPTVTPTVKLEGRCVASYSSYYGGMQFVEQPLLALPMRCSAQDRIARILSEEIDVGVCMLVCGSPGSGKSAVATIAATMLSATGRKPVVVRGYSPLSNTGSIYKIMNSYKPSREAPLIVCLDEFDIAVEKVLSGGKTTLPEKRAAPEIIDKSTLSGYFDKLATYNYFAVVATSNRPVSWWKEPERAFAVRPGRFSFIETLEQPASEEVRALVGSGAAHYGIKTLGTFEDMTFGKTSLGDLAEILKRSHGDAARVHLALAQIRE